MENKIARIPVASHGLHKHKYNYPWLSSINFGDVMPCYINTLRRGERDKPSAGLYSQLMPIAHNAFATGRYNFKAVFVPYKLVWRPYYNFAEQTEFNSNGEVFTPKYYPFIDHGIFSEYLVGSTDLFENGDASNYDVIAYRTTTNTSLYYLATPAGARVLRILGALGCMPSFVLDDTDTINILPLLCYIKAYADYYFPSNYIGGQTYRVLSQFFERDDLSFNNLGHGLVQALEVCSQNFYEDSIFDMAWDRPTTPNTSGAIPSVNIDDVTDPNGSLQGARVDNTTIPEKTPAAILGKTPAFTQYLVDALSSVSKWAKRHQLAGARLLDRFLVARGISLPSDSARMSYYIGQRNVEIQVSGVENNTDVNLGELAGRGVASSGDKPLSFECRAEDDGIFLVIVSALPDASLPILYDGFAARKDFMDNYHAEFDKLSPAAIPTRVVQLGVNGYENFVQNLSGESVFGFINQYWDEIQERPRLLGDFILKSRGAEELSAYHTFRLLPNSLQRHHSYDFIRMSDSYQYNRLFYSARNENLMLFLRWYGVQYKEKLPLGDSYDWDDDELNRRVSVVVGGSQK